ncbi:MAG: hypothetical protein R2710_30645 [Acidimicrobiales bacterium]
MDQRSSRSASGGEDRLHHVDGGGVVQSNRTVCQGDSPSVRTVTPAASMPAERLGFGVPLGDLLGGELAAGFGCDQ